eukprot:365863-Chlamydomonas_euryale.AAC.4
MIACMRLQAQFQAQKVEISQLHARLIREAEVHDQWQKQHYQDAKRLEDRIAELSFWKSTAGEKLTAAERTNAGLRSKVDELLRLNDRLSSGVVDRSAVAARISVTTPPHMPFEASSYRALLCGLLGLSCVGLLGVPEEHPLGPRGPFSPKLCATCRARAAAWLPSAATQPCRPCCSTGPYRVREPDAVGV